MSPGAAGQRTKNKKKNPKNKTLNPRPPHVQGHTVHDVEESVTSHSSFCVILIVSNS